MFRLSCFSITLRQPAHKGFIGRHGSLNCESVAVWLAGASVVAFVAGRGRDGIQSTLQQIGFRDKGMKPRVVKQLLAAGCKPNARFLGFDEKWGTDVFSA